MFLHPGTVVGVEETNPAGSADSLIVRELWQFGLSMTRDRVGQKLLFRKDEAGATDATVLLDEEVRTGEVDGVVDDGPVVPGDLVFGLNVSVQVSKILLCVATDGTGEGGLEVGSSPGPEHQGAPDCLDPPGSVSEVDVVGQFVPGGELVSLTGPTLVAQAGPAGVTGPGDLGVEDSSALETPRQSQVPGQDDPASPGQLLAVERLEEVAGGQVEPQLAHGEEDLAAGRTDLTAEDLLAVLGGEVRLEGRLAPGKPITQLAGQGGQAGVA